MPRATLFGKVFGSSVGLIVLTAVLIGWPASRRVVGDAREQTETALHDRVVLLAEIALPALAAGSTSDMQARVTALAKRTGARLTVIAKDGVVVADSAKRPAVMDNHGDRPEIMHSASHEFGRATRYSETIEKEMMYVAQRVESEGRVLGYVRVALPLIDLDGRLARLRWAVLGAAGIAVLIGLLLALMAARRLSRPLRSMMDAASAIAGGDYERRVHAPTRDEIGDLADAFNEMADQLGQRVRTISRDQREMRAILSGMGEGVVAVDRDERIVLLNDAAGRMLGVVPQEAASLPIWEVVRLEAVTDAVSVAIREDTVERRDVVMARGGKDRQLRLNATPLRTTEGKNAGAVIVLDDVTDVARLEKVRRDFVTNASHELKTPVSAIRGLVETILSDEQMPGETRRSFLVRIGRQSERLGELVDGMLTLSRVEAAAPGRARLPVDLCVHVRKAIEAASELQRSCGVALEIDLPETATLVLGEPEALRRIAGNLLDNALKYTPESGTVTISVRRGGDAVVLEVTDTGPGIPEDKQERIFERFFRVDDGRSRDVGGTGLGLAIVKHLAQALGGTVELESSPGLGSTFRVRLLPA